MRGWLGSGWVRRRRLDRLFVRSLARRGHVTPGVKETAWMVALAYSMGGRREEEEEDARIAAARGSLHDVPLEFVGEVARARAVAEASHVESGAAS